MSGSADAARGAIQFRNLVGVQFEKAPRHLRYSRLSSVVGRRQRHGPALRFHARRVQFCSSLHDRDVAGDPYPKLEPSQRGRTDCLILHTEEIERYQSCE
jgi:hypothetical protein